MTGLTEGSEHHADKGEPSERRPTDPPGSQHPKREPAERAEIAGTKLAKIIEEHMPKGWGFALTMFALEGFGPGHASYISSVNPEDAAKGMRDTADYLERREGIYKDEESQRLALAIQICIRNGCTVQPPDLP